MKYTTARLYKPKSGNDWYVYFKFEDPSTGEMKMFKLRDGLNRIVSKSERKTEGELRAAGVNKDLKSGWSPFGVYAAEVDNRPLLEIMAEMMEIKRGVLRERSVEHYKHAINVMRDFLGHQSMQSIRPSKFDQALTLKFSDYLLTERKVSGRTHNNYIEDMRNYFNMMMERDFVKENYFTKIVKKPADVGKNYAYTKEQRILIKDYLYRNKSPFYLVSQCIYYFLIRPKEVVELQRKRVNFEDGIITIISGSGKNRRQRTAVIPDHFKKELKESWEKTPPEWYLFGKNFIPGPEPIRRNRLSEAHRKILDDLGIGKEHTLYSWKHTGFVEAIKSGMDLYSVMRQAGHSSLQEMMPYVKSMGLVANTEFSTKQPKF
jgi:integrase